MRDEPAIMKSIMDQEDVGTTTATSLAHLHERIDQFELALLESNQLMEFQVRHDFTRGLYIRHLFLPAGSLNVSKLHKTQHPYLILKGRVSVFAPDQGSVLIEAPYLGCTEPGARRIVYAHEDSIWVTFHPNPDDEHDLVVLEDRIIERRDCADGSGRTTYEVFTEQLARQMAEHVASASIKGDLS